MSEQLLMGIYASRQRGVYLYRCLAKLPGVEDIKENWRWRLNLWTGKDKDLFRVQMSDAWKSLQDAYPAYRSSSWSHYSPSTTVPFSVEEVKKMQEKNINWKQYLPGAPGKPERTVEEMKQWLKGDEDEL